MDWMHMRTGWTQIEHTRLYPTGWTPNEHTMVSPFDGFVFYFEVDGADIHDMIEKREQLVGELTRDWDLKWPFNKPNPVIACTGGQIAYPSNGRAACFFFFVRFHAARLSIPLRMLCHMPDPGMGLLMRNPFTDAPDPRVEIWIASGQLTTAAQHLASLRWAALRRWVRTRWISFYWKELTFSNLYAPGGADGRLEHEALLAAFDAA